MVGAYGPRFQTSVLLVPRSTNAMLGSRNPVHGLDVSRISDHRALRARDHSEPWPGPAEHRSGRFSSGILEMQRPSLLSKSGARNPFTKYLLE